MKSLKWAFAAAVISLLAACGGGGGNEGTSPFGNGACTPGAAGCTASSSAAAVDVLASAVQVGSGGDTVTVSAVIKDATNLGLAGAPVSFAATSGTLTSASVVTDASGVATATFSAGANRSNRTATITATSGGASGSVSLDIVGTTLSYAGDTTVALNGTSTISVKAVDSKGAVISSLPVTVSSSLNNGLSATSITTNGQGTASLTYTASAAGTDTLTFTGAGTTATPSIQVSAADFSFVSPAADTHITVGSSQTLTVRYLSSNVPQAGQLVTFAATAGVVTPTSATTDAAGMATVSISSATASPAVVQATVSGAAVQATLPVLFVAQQPSKLVLQVTPTAIGPNPGGATAQQAQLRATVTDANGNPVSGATVNFNRLADPSGGNLSQASAVTDASGQATVQYIAGGSTTANNGVQVRATVLGFPGVFGDAQLTVNQSALFIALGTGNVIGNLDEQTYKKDWTVYVTDANGVAVPNISLTIKVLPLRYGKGNLSFQGTTWSYNVAYFCQNEDANYNGILDAGEDFNGDGRLQPGNVISVTTATTPTAGASGLAKTDSNGRATITLLYAESYAPWVEVALVAQAIVSGTESSTQAVFFVSGSAPDFTSATNPPAGVISPFGKNDCATPN
ncbi:MAG: Ig-like domain-containing protein [Caldimonas sp.]